MQLLLPDRIGNRDFKSSILQTEWNGVVAETFAGGMFPGSNGRSFGDFGRVAGSAQHRG